MGLFDGLEKLGKAAIGVALLPVDAVREVLPIEDDGDVPGDKLARRGKKIKDNLKDALEEIDK